MIMISTYGTLEESETEAKRTYKGKEGQDITTTFNYPIPFDDYYKYRHMVDNHNSNRHYPISVEESLGSRRWAIRQFSFLLGLTEVNVKLAMHGRSNDEEPVSMLDFRQRLAKELIHIDWYSEECSQQGAPIQRASTRKRKAEHLMKTCPVYTGLYNADKKNFKKTKKMYSVLCCYNCKHTTRTCCQCNPAVAMCKTCFGIHSVGIL